MKKRTATLLLIAIAMLQISSTVTQSKENPSWLLGQWEGIGFQVDMTKSTWLMEVDFKKETTKINYPSLNCSGYWILKKQEKDRLVFKENIQKGEDRCMDNGMLVITKVNKNHISFSYFNEHNQTLGAYATLVRTNYSKNPIHSFRNKL